MWPQAQPTPATSVPPSFLSTRALLARGLTRRQIDRCVSDGRLLRVRNGRYLPHGTHQEVLRVARLGGRVDCITLLRMLGVFVLDSGRLHIQVSPGSSRLPKRPPGVVCHWRESPVGREDLCADIIGALAQACRCQEPRAAIATLDSAWHLGLVDEDGISAVFALLPRRFRGLRSLLDPRSEAGSETIMRLMLRMLGCGVEVQATIAGVGRVDFVVDGWLIIECDSEAHHSGWAAQKRDRRRDLAAARLGYTTIRPIAEDILFHREQTFASLKTILSTRAAWIAAQNSSSKRARGRSRPV
jgi:very-short-patch-repair endonuclease